MTTLLRSEIAAPLALRMATPARESKTHPANVVNLAAAEDAVRQLLVALGEDPDREGLVETPRRAAKAMVELMAGRFADAGTHLRRSFEQRSEEAVILKNIEFFSLCEHHLLPFVGHVSLAYLPNNGRVVGLSKLARTVEVFARRPQLQERLTNQIADALEEHARPRGVAVFVQAEHMCMKMRGVCKMQAVMQTFAMRGEYRTNDVKHSEIVSLLTTGSR